MAVQNMSIRSPNLDSPAEDPSVHTWRVRCLFFFLNLKFTVAPPPPIFLLPVHLSIITFLQTKFLNSAQLLDGFSNPVVLFHESHLGQGVANPLVAAEMKAWLALLGCSVERLGAVGMHVIEIPWIRLHKGSVYREVFRLLITSYQAMNSDL